MTDVAATQSTEATSFEELLEFLKLNRGFDFTGYKRSSLERRIFKRMQQVGVDGFADYQDYLEVHPDEFRELFNTILHQRHRVLPRQGLVGLPVRGGAARPARVRARERADPGLVRWLRFGRGGVHGWPSRSPRRWARRRTPRG